MQKLGLEVRWERLSTRLHSHRGVVCTKTSTKHLSEVPPSDLLSQHKILMLQYPLVLGHRPEQDNTTLLCKGLLGGQQVSDEQRDAGKAVPFQPVQVI